MPEANRGLKVIHRVITITKLALFSLSLTDSVSCQTRRDFAMRAYLK